MARWASDYLRADKNMLKCKSGKESREKRRRGNKVQKKYSEHCVGGVEGKMRNLNFGEGCTCVFSSVIFYQRNSTTSSVLKKNKLQFSP